MKLPSGNLDSSRTLTLSLEHNGGVGMFLAGLSPPAGLDLTRKIDWRGGTTLLPEFDGRERTTSCKRDEDSTKNDFIDYLNV